MVSVKTLDPDKIKSVYDLCINRVSEASARGLGCVTLFSGRLSDIGSPEHTQVYLYLENRGIDVYFHKAGKIWFTVGNWMRER